MRLHSCTKFVTQSLDRDVMDVMEGFPPCVELHRRQATLPGITRHCIARVEDCFRMNMWDQECKNSTRHRQRLAQSLSYTDVISHSQ